MIQFLRIGLFLLLLGSAYGLDTTLVLNWDDQSDDETGFAIERAAGGSAFVEIAKVSANVTRFTDTGLTVGAPYSYRVRAYNLAGYSRYSNVATGLPLPPVPAPPVIVLQPSSPSNLVVGQDAALSLEVAGNPIPTIQWQVSGDGGVTWSNITNAKPYSGATTNTLTLSATPATFDRNRYRAVVTNEFGSATSATVLLAVNAPSRLANLSIRATAGTASNTLIVGFVVNAGAPKSLLVRGIGPALAPFGVSAPLADPILSLFEGSKPVETNDDWGATASRDLLASTAVALGAFVLPVASHDAALLRLVNPGASSAQITSKDSSSGAALLELYDASLGSDNRMTNFSARSFVDNAVNAPIVGFVITGPTSLRVLVRAVGPTLSSLGVTGVLADPQLLLYRQGRSIPLQQNNDWGGSLALKTAFTSVGAFALPDASRDAALLLELPPGAYTTQILGVNNGTGVALIEVYEIP